MNPIKITQLSIFKKFFLVLCLTLYSIGIMGQDFHSTLSAFEERRKIAFQANDWETLFNIEKEFDIFYDDVTHRTLEATLEYAFLKLYVSYGYMHFKNYKQAESTLIYALSLAQPFAKTRQQINSTLAHCYSYMAMEKEAYSNYQDAIQYSLLTISYASLAQNTKLLCSQNITLGKEYTKIQDYAKAEAAFSEAQRLLTKLGNLDSYAAKLAYEQVELETQRENYQLAIEYAEQAYTIYSDSSDPNKTLNLIVVSQGLANLYRFELHNEEKAAYWENITKTLKQKDESDEASNSKLLRYKKWLTSTIELQLSGKDEEALSQFTQMIQELEQKKSIDHSLVLADCYDSRGKCHIKMQRFKDACSDINKAITIYQSLNENKLLVDCYTFLATAYFQESQLENAIEAMHNAATIAESIYDSDSKKLAACYSSLANAYAFHGDFELAKLYLIKATDINETVVKRTFSYLTSQERDSYWTITQKDILDIQPFLLKLGESQSEYTDELYDVQLLSKGLLLQSDIELQLLSAQSPHLQSLLSEVIRIRKILLQDNLSTDSVRALKHQAEKIERDLTVSSSEVGDFLHFLDITHSHIKNTLSPNAIAIEFATFKYGKDSLMTTAYVIKKDWAHVKMIPLFEERDILPLMETEDAKGKINLLYSFGPSGIKLTDIIWNQILQYIQPNDTVYFAPTGLLHQIAIENLPYDSTHTMGDVYNLVRLSSTRELALHKTPITHKTATLYGDIRYGTTPEKMYAYSRKYRDVLRDGAEDLPGTKLELEAIAPILMNQNIKVQTFTADTANEESFKALSGTKQNILHIGTHGFYWSDTTAQRQQFFAQKQILANDRPEPQQIDPLHRCGLLFAGANTALAGDAHRLEKGVDDGILTAKEISLMDLRGTDIVVLSACETGLGDITGDGVFGLQRGFKMAGAQTILMSLWKVHDDATRLLMTSFYRHYANGLSKREAFRKAQQEVRNYTGATSESEDRFYPSQDKFLNKINHTSESTSHSYKDIQPTTDKSNTHPYADPYYWAGFILLD